MKKVKIFLASSEDLRDESLELADLVEHLNLILEPQDIHIYLDKWEYLDSSGSGKGQTEGEGKRYDDALEDCEICMVVFGKEFGSYTEKELRSAYERVCKEGVNPSKLYVYFKNIDGLTEDLKRFRDSFPDVYGHFTGKFSDVNTLKNDFLLQFQLFQSQNLQDICPIEIKDSKVTVFGKDLFIDLMKIPFLGNNDEYNKLKKEIEYIKEALKHLPKDIPFYSQQVTYLQEKEDNLKTMEQSIWDTALQIAGLNGKKSSERLRKAIELFNNGDNKGANAILNTEKISADINKEINAKKFHLQAVEIHNENIKLLIDELEMKVKTLENEMAKGWENKVIELYIKIIRASKEAYGSIDFHVGFSIRKLSGIFKRLKKYDDVYPLERELLLIYLNNGELNDRAKNNLVKEIGIPYRNEISEYKKIDLDYTIRSIEILSEKNQIFNCQLAKLYNHVANYYSNINNTKKALDYYLKSIKVQSFNSKSVPRISFTSSNQDELLNLLESNYNLVDEVSLTYLYNSIAFLYLREKDYERSINYYNRVLDLNVKSHVTNTAILNNVQNYIKLNQLDRAIKYCDDQLKKGINFLGLQTYAKLYLDIANCFFLKRSYKEALKYYLKLIDFEKENPDLNLITLRGPGFEYEKIANCYFKLKDYLNCIKYNIMAVNIREKVSQTRNFNFENLLDDNFYLIGLCYYKLKKKDDAIEYFQKCFSIRKRNLGLKDKRTVFIINTIGQVFCKEKKIDKALEYIGMAYEISKKTDRTEEEATYLNRLGRVYALMGDNETAKTKFEEAISLLPEDHPEAIDAKKRLKELKQNS